MLEIQDFDFRFRPKADILIDTHRISAFEFIAYLQIGVIENTQSVRQPTEQTELLQELDPDPRNNPWTIVGTKVAAQ